MLQNLQNSAEFQNFQLDNLVDSEKCWKTRICLQRSVPIQPKTSETLQKTITPQSVIAVKCFKREFGVLGPKTNTREFDKNEQCLKKIEKRLNFLSENSVFWGPKLISNYSRQLRIGEYTPQYVVIAYDDIFNRYLTCNWNLP